MNFSRKTSMLVGLLLMLGSTLIAQTDAQEKDILRLLKVSGTEATFKNAISSMMDMMAQNMAFTDEKVLKELKEEMSTDENIADIISEMKTIYKQHFSQADILGMIQFYESPIGKKLVMEQPAIMVESMQMGQTWGRAVGEKVAKRMMEKKN